MNGRMEEPQRHFLRTVLTTSGVRYMPPVGFRGEANAKGDSTASALGAVGQQLQDFRSSVVKEISDDYAIE